MMLLRWEETACPDSGLPLVWMRAVSRSGDLGQCKGRLLSILLPPGLRRCNPAHTIFLLNSRCSDREQFFPSFFTLPGPPGAGQSRAPEPARPGPFLHFSGCSETLVPERAGTDVGPGFRGTYIPCRPCSGLRVLNFQEMNAMQCSHRHP